MGAGARITHEFHYICMALRLIEGRRANASADIMQATSDTNKRIAKNTLALYARMLFTMAVSLYTSRVVLATLGVDDFGLYNVVGGFVAMFSFFNAAMSSATQRYMNFELGRGDAERLGRVFCTSVNIHALISLLVLALSETVGLWFVYTQLSIPADRFTAALWVYHSSVLATVVMVMSIPYNAAIIAHERMGAFAYISVLEVVLKLLIVYLLVAADVDKLKLYAVLMLLVQLLVRVIYGRYSGRHFAETRYRRMWDGPLFREMTAFAGWNLFGNIAAVAFTQGLNVLLNMFFGPAVNAARGIAVQVQNAIKGFCVNFQTALNPQITKSYAAGDTAYMHSLVFTSSKFSYFLLLMLSLPVMLETPVILGWWLGTVPAHTVAFVRYILVISMVDSLANPLIQAASATGRIRRYQAVVGTMLVCILPAAYVALKLGAPPEGVFVVQLAVFCVAQLARIWMLRPLVSLSLRAYLRKTAWPICCVSAVSLVVPLAVYVSLQPSAVRFVVVCASSALSVAASVYFIGLTQGERTFLIDRVKAAVRKVRR